MKVVEYKEKEGSIRSKVNKKRHSLQFLPISMETISKIKTVKYDSQDLKTSYLIDIIHNLLLKYYFKKENLFNLSSTILKEKYGHRYNYYMNYLTKNQYIILVKKHQKGKNSRVYKLSDDIINSSIIRYKNQDNILLKKYRKAVSLVEESDTNYGRLILPEVKTKLVNDLFSVNIDYVRSIFFLDSTNQDVDIYNKNKYSVDCIRDNHIFYHFDDYGRMHTNFTILKSFIRKNCLLIDGEETCEIDIPNSQPLFLSKLINDEDIFIVNKEEFELFRMLTLNGKFYQYLMDNSVVKLDKKATKEIVYKVLFGKNYRNAHDLLFCKLFPTIYNFIKSYKKEKNDYRVISYELQKAESNLVFNKIIKKIMSIYPEIKLVTVHDSIICSKKYKEVVEIIFNKLLKDEFEFD